MFWDVLGVCWMFFLLFWSVLCVWGLVFDVHGCFWGVWGEIVLRIGATNICFCLL